DGHFDPNDYILFYGKGADTWSWDSTQKLYVHQKNIYSDQSFYFLTIESTPGLRINLKNQSSASPTHQVSTYNDYAFYEKDEINLIKSGRQWFGKELLNSQSPTISFQFDNIDETTPFRVRMSAAARSTAQSSIDLKYRTQQSSLFIDPISLSSSTYDYAFTGIDTCTFTQPKAKLDFTISYNKTSDIATGWLEFLEVNVRRKLIFSTGQLQFSDVASFGKSNVARFTITNGSQATVWEITDPLHPAKINTTQSGTDLAFALSADTLRNFMAFDNSGFLQPQIVGPVPNQDLHASVVPDLLIVTDPLFIDAAKRLADFRTTNDGLNVLIVNTGNIYNEFSSGAQDLSAIRYFCKMLYDRGTATQKLRYLLLMGDASYDYKNRIPANTNFIPTYESANSVSTINSFATDDYLGMLDHGSGGSSNDFINLGIGRLPVKTAAEAIGVVEKIIHYSVNTPLVTGDWRNSICFVADDQESNIFMDQSEDLANTVSNVNPNFTIDKIYLDAYPEVTSASGNTYPEVNQAITQHVNNGTLLINYTGHGGEEGWADEKVLTVSDIANWHSYDNLPVFITATCEFSRFDDPQVLSAGEQILLNPNSGGAALISTVRLTFGSPNLFMNKSLLSNWLTPAGLQLRIGDVLRQAKLENGNTVNTQKILLIGDPTMKLAAPRYKVITSLINDKIPGNDTLHALSKVTVKGYIADNSNSKMTGFNGILYSSVFDKPLLVNTLGNNGGTVFSFWLQKSLIYKGTADVKDGEFNFSFIVPKDIAFRYGNSRFSYYASNGTNDAAGNDERPIIGGFSNDTIADKTGPAVRLFMNDTLFRSGGLTGDGPTLLALVSDESGINTLGTGIGHDITAVIDGQTDHTLILNDYFESETNS
ncbi:MAG: type IX secretion system sortase PorU, partial [Bacteroidota bacterium]|nr:type IX secretion system sortase PorU [Bacteroidota bacterium]